MKILEGSLKRLQTDQIDLIHIHDLKGDDDLAAIEAKDGVLAVLRKLRDQKVTRFIGVTSHTDPTVLKTALERHDFDCTQMALNAALVGMKCSPKGMVPNTDMHDQLRDRRPAGGPGEEDGHHRHEDLRAGGAGRRRARRTSCSTTRCRCQ